MTAPNLLVVEDDPDDVYAFRLAIERACPGARLVFLSDGQEAIDYLSANRDGKLPCHLLLDLKLPRVTGLEVLRWLRAQPGLAELPVTILSGSQLSEEVAEARRLGADYLVKPLQLAEYVEMLRGFCSRRGWSS